MSDNGFTLSFTVDQSPGQAFAAILDPRSWWSQNIEGPTTQVGDIFSYEVQGVHKAKAELVELVPNQVVVWKFTENWFSFVKDTAEWVDTRLDFRIAQLNGKTEVRFTHVGLTPQLECYDACEGAWTGYITESLKALIEAGAGNPNQEREEDLENLRA